MSSVASTVSDVFLFLFLVTIILVSILGNVLVVIAVVTDQRLRKLSNLFLVSSILLDISTGII